MKDFLKKLIARKKTEYKITETRFDKSNDETEIRALGETLSALRQEIEDAENQLAELEGDNGANGEGGGVDPTTANRSTQVNGNIVNSFAQNPQLTATRENVLDSMEYRNAFAEYVRTGNTSGFSALEQRAADDGMAITTDVGKIIPNTIMKEVIKNLKVYGNLYNRVRKLNVKGGVEFPIEDLVPTVSWITETNTAAYQAVPEIKTSVSFGYHICEARLAQSLLSQIVTLDYLETEIAKLLAEAFIKEFDRIIINGSGAGQPLGILNDARVAADHKIKFALTDLEDWTKFRTKLFAKIPLAYRGQGIIVTTVATWETYFMTLKDANNRPLYTETFDVTDGTTTCRFAGREVLLVENDIIKDYDTATTNEAFALYFRPHDYAINSQLQIGFKRYYKDDDNKWINKGLCIMDGKLLDVNGVYILTK